MLVQKTGYIMKRKQTVHHDVLKQISQTGLGMNVEIQPSMARIGQKFTSRPTMREKKLSSTDWRRAGRESDSTQTAHT